MVIHLPRSRLRPPPRPLPLAPLPTHLRRRCPRLLRLRAPPLHGRALHARHPHYVHPGRHLPGQRGARSDFNGRCGVLSEVPICHHLSVLDDVVGGEGVDFDVLQESLQSAAEADDAVVVGAGRGRRAVLGLLGEPVGELCGRFRGISSSVGYLHLASIRGRRELTSFSGCRAMQLSPKRAGEQ